MTSFSIQSFGCRVNQAEAFSWAESFQRHGLKYEENFSQSDMVVINSCTLTSRADSDLRGFIRRISRINPKAKMIVTGCFVERASEELRKNPQVLHLFSNAQKSKLSDKVLSCIPRKEQFSIQSFRSRALVKIQDGCNFQCSFCIIPQVRGKSVSVKREKIVDQIKGFINQGFKEVVLTGIHLCSYGRDFKPECSLLRLLQDIEGLEGLGQIRLSSLDPRFLTHPLIKHITSSRKVCPHFHLSLQTGSDEVLRQMGRKIKIEDYKKILNAFRERSSLAAIGADVIVGFPGETEQDFEQTYRFLKDSPLTYFHVFSYSPRPGTEAASWSQVNGKIKKERTVLLRKLSRVKSESFRQNFVGKDCEAIVIKKNGSGNEVLTSNYFKVFIPFCPRNEKETVRVRITEIGGRRATGQILSS